MAKLYIFITLRLIIIGTGVYAIINRIQLPVVIPCLIIIIIYTINDLKKVNK